MVALGVASVRLVDGLHPWRQQYLPGVRQWGLDASLFKTIPITERVVLRFNAAFFNALNAPGNPNAIGGGLLITRSSGQGARELQLTPRLSWQGDGRVWGRVGRAISLTSAAEPG